MRYFLICLFGLICWSCSTSRLVEKNRDALIESYYDSPVMAAGRDTAVLKERAILKKWAFCRCLMLQYPKDGYLRTDGALMGYEEIGLHGNRAYEAVDSFIVKWCKKKYSSKSKSNLYLMQCIDMYDSRALDSVISAQDSEINWPLEGSR